MIKSNSTLLLPCFSLLLGTLHSGAATPDPLVQWHEAADLNGAEKLLSYHSKVTDAQQGKVLQISAEPVTKISKKSTTWLKAFTRLPVTAPPEGSAGISFEYKGNGSPYFASVMVGRDDNLFLGYEVTFPLDSTEWRSMTVPWSDFVNNSLPWDKQARLSMKDFAITPEEVKWVGFGRGNCFHNFYTPNFGFSIRNIRAVSSLPQQTAASYSKGLNHVTGLIQQKQPVKILLLGDSITDFGKNRSYGWHFAQFLQKKRRLPACPVANTGVAGHSVRAGSIVLPRSLRAMPQPDLVCIMYGANDCKAVTHGFDEAVFAKNLGHMIDRVRAATGGKADIVLLNGVPRLNKKGGTTTGEVEKIVGAFNTVAKEKEVALCDTFTAYLALTPDQKQAYYRDTVHQNQTGLTAIGEMLFKFIDSTVPRD